MRTYDFWFGGGWLTLWYLLFYASMIPTYAFLRSLRGQKKRRRRESLLLGYTVASSLLIVFSAAHTVAFLLGWEVGWLIKIFVAGLVLFMACTVAWSIIPLMMKRSDSRLIVACIHIVVLAFIGANLFSLWVVQERVEAAGHDRGVFHRQP